jgi:CRP/FNR family transcriptional regulator, dissimilatory nitrate respiration regulator
MIGDNLPRRYGRGEEIFVQGDKAKGFFCMIEGWSRLYRMREDGKEVVVAIFSRGETFVTAA